jgi:phosphatidylglycerol---prolipoprotein diacylglyceryl transferase
MLPKLFHIGGFFIPAYGLMVTVGVFLALLLAKRLALRAGMNGDQVFDMGVSIVIAGLIGSKALLIVTDRTFLDSWESAWYLLRSGGVFYGGIVFGVAAALYYFRKYKLPVWKTADIFGVGVPLAHSFGRLGCFAAGCCWGKECSLPWAVTFTNPDAHQITGVPLNVPLQPTQLYEALFLAALFGFIYWRYSKKRFDGQVFLTYVILYATFRFCIEFLRGDPRGTFLGTFSTSQAIAVGLFATAAIAYAIRNKAIYRIRP